MYLLNAITFKEDNNMSKAKNLVYKIAATCTTFLSAVLFVCANTSSCMAIHQPKAPENLSKFSKIQ